MAKLKAPLMSLGASGAIGKALVFFGWKGIDCVREYVVPSNPKTTAQNTQRGFLAACVDKIHVMQALTNRPLDAADAAAYALLGSLRATPRTWFNTIVKQWCDQKVAGKIPVLFRDGSATAGVDEITFTSDFNTESADIISGKIHYGTSKSSLINSVACTKAELVAGKAVTGLTTGTKYYLQFRTLLPATMLNSNTGIFFATPT